MKTWVEEFSSETGCGLEGTINAYCRKYNYEIISISVVQAHGMFYAFCVVKEGADNG